MRRYVLLLVFISLLVGCVERGGEIKEPVEVLDVKAVVDYYVLGGYTGGAKEGFFVATGDMDVAWGKARTIATGEVEQAVEFDAGEPLNFVVLRGIFPTGGYGLEIDRVEKTGNIFAVHAIYTDPGRGMMVTEAFTQPAALIPIGELSKGSYEAKLRVTRILKSAEGDKILEEGNEHANIAFVVK